MLSIAGPVVEKIWLGQARQYILLEHQLKGHHSQIEAANIQYDHKTGHEGVPGKAEGLPIFGQSLALCR
jgi:hypothetical protein